MHPWALVSPASRGIGLSLGRHVLQTTKVPVVATARNDLDKTKAKLLEDLDVSGDRVTMLQVDVLGMRLT